MKIKKAFIFLFALIFIFSLSACNKNNDNNTDEAVANSQEERKESSMVKIDTYRESASPANYSIEGKNTAAIQFNVKKPFSGIEIYCSTIGNNNQKVSLSLYEFESDYPTTIKNKSPLITQTYNDISANSWLMLKFKENPEGNYLLVIHNGSEYINLISEAPSPTLQDKITNYYNGIKIETGSFRNRILFNEKNFGEFVDSELYIGQLTEEAKPVEN